MKAILKALTLTVLLLLSFGAFAQSADEPLEDVEFEVDCSDCDESTTAPEWELMGSYHWQTRTPVGDHHTGTVQINGDGVMFQGDYSRNPMNNTPVLHGSGWWTIDSGGGMEPFSPFIVPPDE